MAKYVTQTALNTLWNGLKTKLRSKMDVGSALTITYDSENRGLRIAPAVLVEDESNQEEGEITNE